MGFMPGPTIWKYIAQNVLGIVIGLPIVRLRVVWNLLWFLNVGGANIGRSI